MRLLVIDVITSSRVESVTAMEQINGVPVKVEAAVKPKKPRAKTKKATADA